MISHRLGAHHDGSDLYVSNSAPEFEEVVQVRLRVNKPELPEHVSIRAVFDGEPKVITAHVSHETETHVWFTADLVIRNFAQNYRWLLTGGAYGYRWLNSTGLHTRDVSDVADFRIVAFPRTPEWMSQSVAYQIFPDRFANSGRSYEVPEYFVAREWSKHPEGRSRNTGREFFGGDLWGIAEKLDYLQELGIDLVYMTPIFPAHSTHRYDAQNFYEVDPLLGGNEALIHLVESAHARGMKVVGDITLNHCGRYHEWFTSALAGDSKTREYFTFDDRLEHGYECWFNVPSLPKFNFHSESLRRKLLTDDDSVLRHWLKPPFNLDGWRVDVANMAGRQGETDLTHEIARIARQVVRECGEDKILIAEHFHDAGPDLTGDGWQGGMNYTGVQAPAWAWLSGEEFLSKASPATGRTETISGADAVAAINDFMSRMPWRSRMASWSLLGSHDTARIRSVVGSSEKQIAAVALMFGLPGTPMIFMGDEYGAEGWWGEDSRTTMPWESIWEINPNIQRAYKSLIQLRRNSPALVRGGLQWLTVTDDAIAFLRESPEEKLLFVVARNSARLDIPNWLGSDGAWQQVFGNYSLENYSVQANEAGASIWREI